MYNKIKYLTEIQYNESKCGILFNNILHTNK